MFRLAWLTDLHLNFLPYERVDEFLAQVGALETDALAISGDVSEARDLERVLDHVAERVARPVYFVLGNHDFYHGSIRQVRGIAERAGVDRVGPGTLHYLSSLDRPVELTRSLAMVGHDGWADARLGDYERSQVMMNDYRLIAELASHGKRERWPILRALGDEAAQHVRRLLPAALDRYENVLLVTHVPPLREACWHEGKPSDDEWAPHFTCKAMGDAILEITRDFPQRRLIVLCGHTHSAGECRPLPNLHILTGAAQYGRPAIQRVLEFD